jgi:hypothetical protein
MSVDRRVLIVDEDGNPLSIGGGTQYSQGDDPVTPVGNAIFWQDTDGLKVPSADNPFPVEIVGAGGGGATEATLLTRLSESDFDTKIGSLTETAPATDTASSGLNGRLQRFAQRLSTLIGLFPTALTAGGNFKVSVQEQAGAVTVSDGGGSLTVDGPLTDTQLRASPVPVSGDFSSDGLTDTQLRASAVPVSLATVPLPTGASTEATLALIKAKTDNLDVALSTRTKPADAQHAIIDSSALPSGAATETTLGTLGTQTTLAAVLAKIIAAPATEATLALIKAKTDNIDVALSTRTKPADAQHAIIDSSALPTGAATETTLGTRLSESDFDTKIGSLTETAPATDTASSGLNGRMQRLAQRITSLIALVPTSLGAKTAANSFAVTLATDDESVALTGAVTETAPTTDTASSGLNGRLQRIAQRLTSLIALVDSNRVSTATLTRPANTTAYASGDEMTDTGGAILQFSGCGLSNGGGGIITGLVISSSVNAATKPVGELRLYDTTSTPATDNAAFDASDGVNDTAVAVIPFGLGSDGLTGTTGNSLFDIDGLVKTFKCAGGDTKLYGRVILKAAYTSPANSDTFKFTLRIG